MGRVNWHDGEFRREMTHAIQVRLDAVASGIVNDIKLDMGQKKHGVKQPTSTTVMTRGKRKGQTVMKNLQRGWVTNRSRPGESPAVQTGHLKDSVTWERISGRLGVRVGTNRKVGLWMEKGVAGGKIITPKNAKVLSWMNTFGTRKFAKRVRQGAIARRPWLRPAIARAAPKIRRAFGA